LNIGLCQDAKQAGKGSREATVDKPNTVTIKWPDAARNGSRTARMMGLDYESTALHFLDALTSEQNVKPHLKPFVLSLSSPTAVPMTSSCRLRCKNASIPKGLHPSYKPHDSKRPIAIIAAL